MVLLLFHRGRHRKIFKFEISVISPCLSLFTSNKKTRQAWNENSKSIFELFFSRSVWLVDKINYQRWQVLGFRPVSFRKKYSDSFGTSLATWFLAFKKAFWRSAMDASDVPIRSIFSFSSLFLKKRANVLLIIIIIQMVQWTTSVETFLRLPDVLYCRVVFIGATPAHLLTCFNRDRIRLGGGVNKCGLPIARLDSSTFSSSAARHVFRFWNTKSYVSVMFVCGWIIFGLLAAWDKIRWSTYGIVYLSNVKSPPAFACFSSKVCFCMTLQNFTLFVLLFFIFRFRAGQNSTFLIKKIQVVFWNLYFLLFCF